MKRFWLFGDVSYYSTGGMYDFIKSFDTAAEAVAFAEKRQKLPILDDCFIEWWHVLDSVGQRIVAGGDERPYSGPAGLPDLCEAGDE